MEADTIVDDINRLGTGATFLGKPIFRPAPERIDGPPPPEPDRFGEVGRSIAGNFLSVGWANQQFDDQKYVNPIVVAGSASHNDAEAGGIRIQNVTNSGFDYRFQEWDYLDQSHATERFHWMAFDEGIHTFPDGTVVEAGETTINGTQSTVSLTAGFSATPVILTQIVTSNDNAAAFSRVRNTSAAGFTVYAEEQEANGTPFSSPHGAETLHYVAILPGGGGTSGHTKGGAPEGMSFNAVFSADNVNGNFRNVPYPGTPNPTVIADMYREDGSDPATLRHQSINNNNIRVRVQEDQSQDGETGHTTEPINLIAFNGVGRLDTTPEPPPEPPADLAAALPPMPGDPPLDEEHTSFLFHVAADLPRSLVALRLPEISKDTLGNGGISLRDLQSGGKNELTATLTGNSAAADAIGEALDMLVQARAHVGRFQEKAIEPVRNFNTLVKTYNVATHSQIVDADVAHEVSELTRLDLLRQTTMTLLPDQTQAAGQRLLALLG